ncbi:MAG: hypothetical protein CL685_01940 [Candidatus Magasanikbacteria bacterium]|nr:hypothetical protein [Candidatus Magasanikbacteria bacterium]|tara:strand:+ start:4267 stop:4482 length:216 start_codon:yes stop_codon:yes gene_type:complete
MPDTPQTQQTDEVSTKDEKIHAMLEEIHQKRLLLEKKVSQLEKDHFLLYKKTVEQKDKQAIHSILQHIIDS